MWIFLGEKNNKHIIVKQSNRLYVIQWTQCIKQLITFYQMLFWEALTLAWHESWFQIGELNLWKLVYSLYCCFKVVFGQYWTSWGYLEKNYSLIGTVSRSHVAASSVWLLRHPSHKPIRLWYSTPTQITTITLPISTKTIIICIIYFYLILYDKTNWYYYNSWQMDG